MIKTMVSVIFMFPFLVLMLLTTLFCFYIYQKISFTYDIQKIIEMLHHMIHKIIVNLFKD